MRFFRQVAVASIGFSALHAQSALAADEAFIALAMQQNENRIRSIARGQNEDVKRLTKLFLDGFVGALPISVPIPAYATNVFSEYVGTMVGNRWQGIAEAQIRARQEEVLRQDLPEFNRQTQVIEEARRIQRELDIEKARRAKIQGPPRPSGFM